MTAEPTTSEHSQVLITDLESRTVGTPGRAGLRPVEEIPSGAALVLVRRAGRPLGMIEVEIGDRQAAAAFSALVAQQAPDDGEEEASAWSDDSPASVTVAIATHNRSELLDGLLTSVVTALDEIPQVATEIVVVDNAPADGSTERIVRSWQGRDARIRYVCEPEPGLALAHNRAVEASTGEVILFTDDDVVVDPSWVRHMIAPFAADPAVACVSGLIMPFDVASTAAAWIEANGGFRKGFEARVVDGGRHRPDDPLFPVRVGAYGSGANMAFRRSHLEAVGGFDPALGAGTRARGGDDLAAFFDVLASGARLVYEPAGIVYHRHHTDMRAIHSYALNYGIGLGAYLAHAVSSAPREVFGVLAHPVAIWRHSRAISPGRPDSLRRRERWTLSARHATGLMLGVPRYVASRRRVRTLERHGRPTRVRPGVGPSPSGRG